MGVVLVAALGDLDGALTLVGYGTLACVVGVIVLGPVVARPMARILGVPLMARPATGGLARGNAMRNPRRTAGTASALMIGVAVWIDPLHWFWPAPNRSTASVPALQASVK